jgi:hypothetical protein
VKEHTQAYLQGDIKQLNELYSMLQNDLDTFKNHQKLDHSEANLLIQSLS